MHAVPSKFVLPKSHTTKYKHLCHSYPFSGAHTHTHTLRHLLNYRNQQHTTANSYIGSASAAVRLHDYRWAVTAGCECGVQVQCNQLLITSCCTSKTGCDKSPGISRTITTTAKITSNPLLERVKAEELQERVCMLQTNNWAVVTAIN